MSSFDSLPLVQMLCNANKVRIEADSFVFVNTVSEKPALDQALADAGYLDKARKQNGDLYFTLNADRWGQLPTVYKDAKAWWDNNSRASQLDVHFYIVDINASSLDDVTHPLISVSRAIIEFRGLVEDLSDHFIEAENCALFFVRDKDEPLQRRVSLSVSYNELLEISKTSFSLEAVLAIRENLNHDDPHKKERNEVMRRSIVKMLDGERNSEGLVFLIKNFDELKTKYKEQYDLYVHNFSVSKLLSEIDQRSLEFNSKLMDFISSSQNKALTIPGALIAMGALIKSKGLIEVLLILIGVWMVKRLVTTSNEILRGTFEDLKWQINTSFKKYKSLSEGHEVYESAQQNQDKLVNKINKTQDKVRDVDKLAWATFWVAVLYSIWVVLNTYVFDGNMVTSMFEAFSSLWNFICLKLSELFLVLETSLPKWG